jgi:hypothetical protein
MAVNVYLEPYNQTFTLSRAMIQNYLPESLLANALELDPTSTVIPITNPIVTPDIMQLIGNYFQGIEPDRHNPNVIAANRYLNIPWLLYYAEPLYDQVQHPAPEQTWDTAANRKLLREAVKQNRPYMVNYLLGKGVNPLDQNLTNFWTPVMKGYADIVNLILSNPQINTKTDILNKGLISATGEGYLDVVRALLQAPTVDPNKAIYAAIRNGRVNILGLLLADPRIKLKIYPDGYSEELRDAAMAGQPEIVQMLIDYGIDPSAREDMAFIFADSAAPRKIETMRVLMQDPRVDPQARDNHVLVNASGMYASQQDVVRLLLSNPRVDPTYPGNAALAAAIKYQRHDVLPLLLADPRVRASAPREMLLEAEAILQQPRPEENYGP